MCQIQVLQLLDDKGSGMQYANAVISRHLLSLISDIKHRSPMWPCFLALLALQSSPFFCKRLLSYCTQSQSIGWLFWWGNVFLWRQQLIKQNVQIMSDLGKLGSNLCAKLQAPPQQNVGHIHAGVTNRFNLHPNHRTSSTSSTHKNLFFSKCDIKFSIWWPQHLISFWESMSVQLDVGSLFGSFKRTSLLSISEKSCGLSLVQPHHIDMQENNQQLKLIRYERQMSRTSVVCEHPFRKPTSLKITSQSSITKKRIVFGTLWCWKELLANRLDLLWSMSFRSLWPMIGRLKGACHGMQLVTDTITLRKKLRWPLCWYQDQVL